MSAERSEAGLVLSTTKAVAGVEIDRLHCRALRMRKSVLTSGRLLDEQARAGGFRTRAWMVTLTYRDESAWAAGHVRAYMRRLADWCRSQGIVRRAVWSLEVTKRGRPHYHVIVWLPKRLALPKPDKCGTWTHGLTRTEIARHAVPYLAKYVSKFTPDAAACLPRGARTHGVSGLDQEGKREVRWWQSPLGARQELGIGADIRRAPGGRFDRLSGVFWRSPWRVSVDGSGRIFIHKVEVSTNESSYSLN